MHSLYKIHPQIILQPIISNALFKITNENLWYNVLSFYRSKIILNHPNCFGRVQIVLDRYKLSWLCPNCFCWVQIILIRLIIDVFPNKIHVYRYSSKLSVWKISRPYLFFVLHAIVFPVKIKFFFYIRSVS